MIDKLQGLNLISLPAITTLILRDNRLVSLAGIERGARNLVTYKPPKTLPPPELTSTCVVVVTNVCRLDIRGNKILDPTEISRLTAAPNFQNLYIQGNPFLRPNRQTYRVTIFNFFRSTPGFTDDITIDGSPPGIVERRHLVDRVFEKPPVPPSSLRMQSPAPITKVSGEEGVIEGTQTAGRNARRKRVHRQRIVSLEEGGTGEAVSTDGEGRDAARSEGEEYRRRLEALREEAGAGWLRVLSESGGLTEKGVDTVQGQS